jgi:predicted MFS family arabinose efflux permease
VVFLAVFAMLRNPAVAFPAVFALGFVYFGFTTALLTTVQQNIDHAVRGRVMSLWMMAFGGTVPLGNLIAGPLIGRVGVTPVLLGGAAIAAVVAWRADLVGAREAGA